MQHWLAHIGIMHTLQQGLLTASHLGQAQQSMHILAPFPHLLESTFRQQNNLGEYLFYLSSKATS